MTSQSPQTDPADLHDDSGLVPQPSPWPTLVQRAWPAARRFLPPSGLLLALLMFPLPWVELQCEKDARKRPPRPPTKAATPALPQGVWQWFLAHFLPSNREWGTVLSQSGLQAARARYSGDARQISDRFEKDFNAKLTWSPLMALLPVILCAGFLSGLLLRAKHGRRIVLTACTLAALGLFVGQIAAGFPMEKTFLEMLQEDLKRNGPTQVAEVSRIRYTFWLGLAVCGVLAAAFALASEWYSAVKSIRQNRWASLRFGLRAFRRPT
jgi:hypothetical protein